MGSHFPLLYDASMFKTVIDKQNVEYHGHNTLQTAGETQPDGSIFRFVQGFSVKVTSLPSAKR